MSGIRVIAGQAKGRKLKLVPGEGTRPISDRVKEALFNIIGADIQGASFLDLFGGTGSVGIEALSRGAEFVRFVDSNRRAVRTIHANLKHTGLEKSSEVLQMDAFRHLQGAPERAFDYVYLAPPQYQGLWSRALSALDETPAWLAPDAWVVVQIHPREFESKTLQNLIEFDQRRYGSTLLIFYALK